jgi:hypothetical protein
VTYCSWVGTVRLKIQTFVKAWNLYIHNLKQLNCLQYNRFGWEWDMSPFEPSHILDSTDDSAVHKLSFINFRSCQSCVVMENNLYWFVIPPALPRSISPLFCTCCVTVFHVTHVATCVRSLCQWLPQNSRFGFLFIKTYTWCNVGHRACCMSTVRRLFECAPHFLDIAISTAWIRPGLQAISQRNFVVYICKVSVVSLLSFVAMSIFLPFVIPLRPVIFPVSQRPFWRLCIVQNLKP